MNDLGNKGYLVFGLILFVWELLPTTLLVGFFRVHRPPQDLVRASGEGWMLGIPWAGVWQGCGAAESMMVAFSPRAPVASSMGRSLVPVPTSLTGLGIVRTRAAPGSMVTAKAPGRNPGPESDPPGSQLALLSHGDLEPGLPTFPLDPATAMPKFPICTR